MLTHTAAATMPAIPNMSAVLTGFSCMAINGSPWLFAASICVGLLVEFWSAAVELSCVWYRYGSSF